MDYKLNKSFYSSMDFYFPYAALLPIFLIIFSKNLKYLKDIVWQIARTLWLKHFFCAKTNFNKHETNIFAEMTSNASTYVVISCEYTFKWFKQHFVDLSKDTYQLPNSPPASDYYSIMAIYQLLLSLFGSFSEASQLLIAG